MLSNVPYSRSVCSVASPSPNLLSTYRRRKLDKLEISEVKTLSCVPPSCPPLPSIEREDKSRARGSRILLCTDVQCSQQSHYPLPNARLPAVHATCKLGLGLSPSRQTVIRYNDSTVIRCYVRPYSPHYAPSLVLSNVPYFRPVCSVASHSPNLVATYRSKKLDNIVIIKISEVKCFVCPILPALS